MNRRAIVILGAIFILIVLTLGFLIFQRSRSKNENTNNTNQTNEPEEYPTPDPGPTDGFSGPVVKLNDDQVISPVLFFQGDGITYLTKQGELYQVTISEEDGKVILSNKTQLTLPPKTGINKIHWPQSGNHFLAEILTPSGAKAWTIYNSESNAYTDLPRQVTSIDWLPQGNKIVYIWLDSNNKSTLNVANPDNSGYKAVADIWENDDELKVSPDGQSILFYRTDSSEAKNSINLTTPDGTLFRSVIKDGYNYGVLWGTDSKSFVFGRRNSASSYELWLGDIADGAIQSLGVTSIVDKVLWDRSGQFIYVAVPSKGNPQTGLTEDKLVRVNILNGEKKEYDLGQGVDMREMFLNSNGDRIFFVNKQDEGLYYVNLNQ